MEGLKKKKRLLITGSTFPRWKGDTEPRFILDYAKVMTKYYDVTVLVPMAPGAKENEILEGVNVVRFHYFPVHQWETLCYPGAIIPRIKEKKIRALLVPFLLVSQKLTLKKICKKVDIVHAHWIIPQGIVQMGIKNVPYIVTGHGGDVTSLNISFIKMMKERCLRNANATVGVSKYICERMKEIYADVNPEMISMGCDPLKFRPEKRNEYYFEHEKKNIVFVGRLVEKKGVCYLIDAMKMVDAKLYIIGKGPLEESLKKQVRVTGVQEKITFVGTKTHDELPEILASADLLVAPSIVAKNGDQEGLPVSIMEAMASGLPVVSGLSGGTKDIIKDGINGYVVDAKNVNQLAEKINLIISNDEQLKHMSLEALKTSKEYSYESIGKKYYGLMQGINQEY